MKKWVLSFKPVSDYDHRDHNDWRGAIEIVSSEKGYFRWGDEPVGEYHQERYIKLNNISDIATGINSDATPNYEYIPNKDDFLAAYFKIAQLGEKTSCRLILDQIEADLKMKGVVPKNDWRRITERNIEHNWNN